MKEEQQRPSAENQGQQGQAPGTQPEEASGPAAAGTESIPNLEEVLRHAELKSQEHHDAWLRAKAEADNIHKRAQVDIANAHKYAIENFSSALLAVQDSLEAALATTN